MNLWEAYIFGDGLLICSQHTEGVHGMLYTLTKTTSKYCFKKIFNEITSDIHVPISTICTVAFSIQQSPWHSSKNLLSSSFIPRHISSSLLSSLPVSSLKASLTQDKTCLFEGVGSYEAALASVPVCSRETDAKVWLERTCPEVCKTLRHILPHGNQIFRTPPIPGSMHECDFIYPWDPQQSFKTSEFEIITYDPILSIMTSQMHVVIIKVMPVDFDMENLKFGVLIEFSYTLRIYEANISAGNKIGFPGHHTRHCNVTSRTCL